MDKDVIEYVPVEQPSEGPKTFTINVTIDPEGGARVEMIGQELKATIGRSQS